MIELRIFLIGMFLVGNFNHFSNASTFSRYLPDEVITLDPLNSFERYSQHAILQIYSPIFKTEDGITPIPHIAKDYIYNKLNKEFIINIRKNIFFHNNKPLTAEDIIFTIKRLCLKMNGKIRILPLINGCTSGKEVFGVQKINEHKIKIKLKKYFPPFISYLASPQFMILPKNFHGKNEKDFFNKPIGTGPYILEKRSNTVVILTSNKNYFLGKPDIEKILLYTESKEKIYERVKNKTIDDIFPLAPPPTYPVEYKKVFVNTASTIFLAFRPNFANYGNLHLRKAIRASIDTNEIQKVLKTIQGFVPATGVIPWGAIGYDSKLPNTHFNSKKILFHIKKAGYNSKSDVPKVIIHSALKDDLSKKLPALIKIQLENAGFRVIIVNQSLPELFRDIKANKIGIMLINPTMSSIDSYQFLEMWRSDFKSKGLNAYDNEFDATLEQALLTPDRYMRANIYKKANGLLMQKAFTINFGYITHKISLRKKRWKYPKLDFMGPFFLDMYKVKNNQD